MRRRAFDPLLGARPLRRVIQRDIEDAISEKILMGDLEDGQKVIVDAEGEGLLGEFTFKGETFEQPEAETGILFLRSMERRDLPRKRSPGRRTMVPFPTMPSSVASLQHESRPDDWLSCFAARIVDTMSTSMMEHGWVMSIRR